MRPMLILPDLNDPRVQEAREDVIEALPYSVEVSIVALAHALCTSVVAATGDVSHVHALVYDAARCYSQNMYDAVEVEVRDIQPDTVRPPKRRPSARATAETLVAEHDEWERKHGDTEAFGGSDF